MSGASYATYRVELTVSGRIVAILPWPAAASDLNCFMTLKLVVKEVAVMLDGPLERTEAEAPPYPAPTSIADKAIEVPPNMPALLKRTLSPLVLVRPIQRSPRYCLLPVCDGLYFSFVSTSRTIQTSPGVCRTFSEKHADGSDQASPIAALRPATPDRPASSPSAGRTIVRSSRWRPGLPRTS